MVVKPAIMRLFGKTGLTTGLPLHSAGLKALQKAFRLGVCLAIPLVLSGCISNQLGSGINDQPSLANSWVRPQDKQEKLGAKEHPAVVAKYGGVYSNKKAENLVAVVLGKLVAVSDDPARIYKVTLLNSPKVNAFALPGGYLYVTRGLLALATDNAELAAVIAHEMAHVSSNHAIVRMEQMASNKIGADVAETLGSSTSTKIALAANELKMAEFSREQEFQADTIGIRMIGQAGFDPYASARFLETMAAYQQMQDHTSDQLRDMGFLSSHPTTPKRVQLAREHASQFGPLGVGAKERDRYLNGIDGLLFGDTSEEGFVRGQTFSHAGLGITFKVPTGYKIENQTKSVLVSGRSDIATRFDAAVLARNADVVNYMKSGWINGLDPSSVRKETINGMQTAVGRAAADGWIFHIRVFHVGDQVYRFITAAPKNAKNPVGVSNSITGTFRQLSETEAQNLKPYEIKVVTASADDTIATLSKTNSLANRLELFKVINGLKAGESVIAGQRYKTVTSN